MKSCRSLKKVYVYVLEHKDKFGSNYETILNNLKKIRKLSKPEKLEEGEYNENSCKKNDTILTHLQYVSDILFFQDDIKEQKYIELYESLELIYHVRRKEIKVLQKNKSICVILMEKCFSRFM